MLIFEDIRSTVSSASGTDIIGYGDEVMIEVLLISTVIIRRQDILQDIYWFEDLKKREERGGEMQSV